MQIKQVTEVPAEFISQLTTTLDQIKRGLENMGGIQRAEYLTLPEYMARVKVSRWKTDMLIKQGLLKYKRVGRKIYIPESEVGRFFAGELDLK